MKGLNGGAVLGSRPCRGRSSFSPEKGPRAAHPYWHDQFGRGAQATGCVTSAARRALGCTSGAIRRSRPGWTMAAGVVEAPGSIVRVAARTIHARGRGYAKKVLELRQQTRSIDRRGPARPPLSRQSRDISPPARRRRAAEPAGSPTKRRANLREPGLPHARHLRRFVQCHCHVLVHVQLSRCARDHSGRARARVTCTSKSTITGTSAQLDVTST